jgi:8-oxo-dGTP diphosphatase
MTTTPKQTASQRIVARAIILGPKGCLVQHKHREERGDYYGLPGGAKEDFETLIEALQRETREEMGCSVLNAALVGVVDYRHREEPGSICDRVECLFTAELPEGYQPANGPKPDRNQRDIIWLSLDAIDDVQFSPPYIGDAIKALVNSKQSFLGYLGAYADPS